ncbi:hypothetical protein [Companilactobacillus jidongensis]|uniref:hypothetical protein n=1 Tax=Companilactobacillus jidongensis TaxID=2486006 RepID=UPI000F76D21F|nr:hypothetical protein [Companilactobacillus jidongensis]
MKSRPYFHYIVIIESDGKDYAYHYSSKIFSEVEEHMNLLRGSIEGLQRIYGMHMLQTDSKSFESVQKMDPYFKGMNITDNIEEFSERYKYYLDNFDFKIVVS